MLDGKNYKAWSSTIHVLLRGFNLWGYIDGARSAPPPPAEAFEASSQSTLNTAASSQFSNWAKWYEDDSPGIV